MIRVIKARAKQYTQISASLYIVLLFGACVYDAPTSALKIGSGNAVAVHSSRSPYAVTSDSFLNTKSKYSRQWTQQALSNQSQRLVVGSFKNWRWSVWATPSVAASYKRWVKSKQAHACKAKAADGTSTCGVLDWSTAFRQMYAATAYLLGKAPLPLWVRLNLVPEGDGFRAKRFWHSQRYVPLEFAFWYPATKGSTAPVQHRRSEALLETVALVGYEMQHVEYDAGDSKGPAWTPGASITKNEANSACWHIAAKLAIAAGRPMTINTPRIKKGVLDGYRTTYGDSSKFSTAAILGPWLTWHDLGRYLERKHPAAVGETEIRIRTTDYATMNDVLEYCRGLTLYPTTMTRKGLPARAVASLRFWKPILAPRQAPGKQDDGTL